MGRLSVPVKSVNFNAASRNLTCANVLQKKSCSCGKSEQWRKQFYPKIKCQFQQQWLFSCQHWEMTIKSHWNSKFWSNSIVSIPFIMHTIELRSVKLIIKGMEFFNFSHSMKQNTSVCRWYCKYIFNYLTFKAKVANVGHILLNRNHFII